MLTPMKAICVLAAGVTAILALPLGSQAKDESTSSSEYRLSDFTIGEIVSGDPVNLDSLSGKVVALEMWGYR